IFFMLQKFRTFEKKLPSELPLDQGMFVTEPKELKQLRFNLLLVPGSTKQVQIKPDPENDVYYFVNFKPGKDGKRFMFREITKMILAGWEISKVDKIEISPQPKVPFDYVALLLNAIHSAKADKEEAIQAMIKKAKEEGNTKAVEAHEKKLVKVTFKASKMKSYE
ncbi:MAG: hypothetical protein K8S87_00580, partial [Planctomycetes bacterium]|nr:hypothetical protein [Planctomycetota bacterium]